MKFGQDVGIWTHKRLRLGRELLLGFGASQYARHAMTPLPPGEAILTVGIMSLTVLIEVALFASIGMF